MSFHSLLLSPLYAGVAATGMLTAITPAAAFDDPGRVSYQTLVSDGGFFSCTFFKEGTGMPGAVNSDGDYTHRASNFSEMQMNAIMKAVNTLEKTFVFKTGDNGQPVRQAQLRFAMTGTLLPTSVAAAADPIISYAYDGKQVPRTQWLESDFGGRKTGETAVVNNLESVLKYGTDVYYSPIVEAIPNIGFPSVPGKGDAYIAFNQNYFNADGSVNGSNLTLESTALHELGHTMGFMHNENSAMGAFMETRLYPNGDSYYVFNGETAMKYNGGAMPLMNNMAMDHLSPQYRDAVMNKYPSENITSFSDLDLAVFQDMGWTIKDSAWSNFESVPEPCSPALLAAGALGLAWRRRR